MNEKPASEGLESVKEIERRTQAQRSASDQFGDWLIFRAGQASSIALHAAWYAAWILWNWSRSPFAPKFDPYPFSALTTLVSLEAIFLSLLILASQGRDSRRAEERAHLDLQVNLLAEKEATKLLQMTRALCLHFKLPEARDPEIADLAKRTRPEELAEAISDLVNDDKLLKDPFPKANNVYTAVADRERASDDQS